MLLKIHILVGLLIISEKSASYPLVNRTTDVETTERDQLKDEGFSQTSTEDLLLTTTDELEVNNETLFTYVTNVSNDLTTHYPNNVEEDSPNICIFEVNKDHIKKTKQEMHSRTAFDGQGYLFFIHLELPFIDKLIVNISEKYQIINSLLEWQFVHKEEKFLVQLPVDFELITFDVLKYVKEESDITVLLNVNNSECTITDKNKDMTIAKLRNYLWKEIFLDFTNYLLCHRQFIQNDYRTYLYYVTTIWKGYDLTCYPSTLENGPILMNKDEFVNIAPLLCYFLSLQFVWIFAILWRHRRDQKHSNGDNKNNDRNVSLAEGPNCVENKIESTEPQQSGTTHDKNTTGTQTEESDYEEQTEDELTFNYRNGDRPYGMKRVLMKIFYSHFSEIECKTNSENYNNNCNEFCNKIRDWTYNLPSFRLMFLTYILILLPFGLYRTIYRKIISDTSHNDYKNVIRMTEPLFYKIIQDEETAFYADVVFATVFPLIGVFFCTALFEYYMSRGKGETSSYGIGYEFIAHIKNFTTVFTDLINIYSICFHFFSTCKRKRNNACCECCDKSKCKCNTCACPIQSTNTESETRNCECEKCTSCHLKRCTCKHCECCITCSKCSCKVGDNEKPNTHDCSGCLCCTLNNQIRCNCANCKCCKNKTTNKHKCRCCNPAKCDFDSCKCCNNDKTRASNEINQCCAKNECKCKKCECKTDEKIIFFVFIGLHLKLIWYFLNVILPILSFVALPLTSNPFIDMKNEEDKKDKRKRKKQETIFRVAKPFIALLYILFVFILLRPMITTFTFVLRSLTYLLFVAMPVRIALFRYFLIALTTLCYFYKYYADILTMFSNLLSDIFEIRKNSSTVAKTEFFQKNEIDEERFTFIVSRLDFVKKKIYYFIFKCIVVLMYLVITMETLLISGKSTTGLHFSEIIEVTFILIGPYAFEMFMTPDHKFTRGNQRDIKDKYKDSEK